LLFVLWLLFPASQHSQSDKGILAIWLQVRAKLHIFFIAHARNGQISTFDQTSDVTIVFADMRNENMQFGP